MSRLLPDNVERPHATPMVGRRFGSWTVIAKAGRKDRGIVCGQRRRELQYLIRCDCGTEVVRTGAQIRYRPNRCAECAEAASAAAGREHSVRLSDGRTIAQVAQASGLKLETVYRRYLRGWPPEYLGLELRPGRGRGGSVDLPERRCTVYPERRAS